MKTNFHNINNYFHSLQIKQKGAQKGLIITAIVLGALAISRNPTLKARGKNLLQKVKNYYPLDGFETFICGGALWILSRVSSDPECSEPQNKINIEEMFARSLSREQQGEGEKYKVEFFGQDNKSNSIAELDLPIVSRKTRFTQPPKTLFIHFKRFKYDQETQRMSKIENHISFPETVTLQGEGIFLEATKSALYKCTGFLVHRGAHYKAYVKIDDKWWECCDINGIKKITDKEADKFREICYLAFLERESSSQEGSENIQDDRKIEHDPGKEPHPLKWANNSCWLHSLCWLLFHNKTLREHLVLHKDQSKIIKNALTRYCEHSLSKKGEPLYLATQILKENAELETPIFSKDITEKPKGQKDAQEGLSALYLALDPRKELEAASPLAFQSIISTNLEINDAMQEEINKKLNMELTTADHVDLVKKEMSKKEVENPFILTLEFN